MITQADLNSRRKRIETLVKAAGLAVVGVLVAPFVLLAIKGLIGAGIALGLGLSIIYFTPVVATKMANWRLKMLKAEATKNPVETLQNDYVKRQEALARFEASIRSFAGEVGLFSDKLETFSKKFPEEAPKFRENLGKMNELLVLRKQKYKEAKNNLALYQMEIQKAGAIWEMGQAAAQMNKAAGMTEEDFFAKIQVETALDSVQKNLNMAFADLEVALLDEDKDGTALLHDKHAAQIVQLEPSKDAPAVPRQRIAEA